MESDLTPDVRNEATNEIKHQYLSAEKAREHARLAAALFDMDQALAETIAWYRDYFGQARWKFSDRAHDSHLERDSRVRDGHDRANAF